ncbi:MAG TPA: hypothetical protein VHU91_01975 [Mycobacteriales bacterium]|jgi:hypothetical protein|nr:hypothetical protein [Mycobacteriales bacterium]
MTAQSHPSLVVPEFHENFPDATSFLQYLSDELTTDADRCSFVADRVMARLGTGFVIAGIRSAGLTNGVLANRGVTDLDVGITNEVANSAGFRSANTIEDLDELLGKHLERELGDHVVFDVRRANGAEYGAVYRVKAFIDKTEVGGLLMDVDRNPHITTQPRITNGGERFCMVELPGLPPGVRTHMDPADVFAGKWFAANLQAEAGLKPDYAKHVCDMGRLLSGRFSRFGLDTNKIADSIAEMSRTSGRPMSQIYPVVPVDRAAKSYRNRAKKYQPDHDLPLDIYSQEFPELNQALEPIATAATQSSGSRFSAADLASFLQQAAPPLSSAMVSSVPIQYALHSKALPSYRPAPLPSGNRDRHFARDPRSIQRGRT